MGNLLRVVTGCILSTVPVCAAELALMPWPAHIETRDGQLTLDGGFRIALCSGGDGYLLRATARFSDSLQRRTGIPMLNAGAVGNDCGHASLRVSITGDGTTGEAASFSGTPVLGEDESYTLRVDPTGAELTAPTQVGVLRGLSTLLQLVQAGPQGFEIPAVDIQDQPRFAWRGFMLDASRHWMPPVVIKRNLEAMAAVRLNVFHWHLVDDQGFRFQSLRYPKLTELGSDGLFYTQDEIRDIVRFAADRGIRVIPEFDVPGHSSALLTAYPELGSAPGPYHIERNWGVFRPTLDPTNERVYEFLDNLFGEVASLFPDEVLHIGGDEVEDSDWKANAHIQDFMRAHQLKTSAELHKYFNHRLGEILSKHGKTMIGWDEILATGLPKSAIIQSWRGKESLAGAARMGYRGVLSAGYYLNYLWPASQHYLNDPLGDAVLTPEESARILGGEGCMWSEYVDAETVDAVMWPRLAAIAERLWSPASVRDLPDMYARLDRMTRALEWTGLEHRSVQEPLLARIAGERPDAGLQLIANSVEAAGHDVRAEARHYTSLTPLNRLVDAARPESEWVRSLEADARAVASGSADGRARARLRDAFRAWCEAPGNIGSIAKDSYLAQDAVPVAALLEKIGESGLTALDDLDQHKPAPASWIDEQKRMVKSCDRPVNEVHVRAARVLALLVDALETRTAER